MDKLKNKYEIIAGFVTLIISFSAFKDELFKISFNLGYATITASQYLLYAVYGFSICLYLYILENIFRDTKFGDWKGWDFIIKCAFVLFVFILMTPLLLILNIIIYPLINLLSHLSHEKKLLISNITSIAAGISTAIAAIITARKTLVERQRKQQQMIEDEEIKELESALKLYADGYYSQSILELFKVLETHLYSELTKKNIRVRRYNFLELLRFATNEQIISKEDIPIINDIRGMRNTAAHTDITYTKQNADIALNFVRELLHRGNAG